MSAESRHHKAMALADKAMDAYRQAFEIERALSEDAEFEPSRSILLRSAAWLAIKADRYSEAERLAKLGLSRDVGMATTLRLREVWLEARRLKKHRSAHTI